MIDDDAVYDDDFCLANGLAGEALTIPSANPTNFHQAISDTDGASIAGRPDLVPLFIEDMTTFWTGVMAPTTT